MNGALTVFTSERGLLAKSYRLGDQGELEKTTAAQLSLGQYDVREFGGVEMLAELIDGLTTQQAISASLPFDGSASGRVVTTATRDANPGALARTKECFSLQGRSGLLFLDHDAAEGRGLSRDELWTLLLQCCPALAEAGVLWRPSGSSHICDGDRDLTGLRGQHVFVLLQDVSDAPRVVEVFAARLWLAGHGRIEVSRSGSLLKRCPIDEAPSDAARLIFAAGAACASPLKQRRGPPVFLGRGGFLDSRSLIPDLSGVELSRFEALVESAKAAAMPDAAKVRAEHATATVARRLPAMLAAGIGAGEAELRIRAAVSAAYGGVLVDNFELTALINGQRVPVTVGEVLRDRERWHEVDFLVPGNEEHRRGRPDARAYLMSASPIIYSLDGNQVFRLRPQIEVIRSARGARSELVESLCRALASQDDIFALDAGPAQLTNGRLVPLTPQRLQNLVGSRVCVTTIRGKGGKDEPTDLARDVAELTLTALQDGGLRHLTAVHSLPFCTPSGKLILREGYDPETGLYLHLPLGQTFNVPVAPTTEQVRAALPVLMAPFRAYSWASPDDAAAAVSAVLTAICRPALDIAPAVLVDAAAQGSGKTKFATALGSLMTGRREGVLPFSGIDDDELRKQIISGVLTGQLFYLLDNCVGFFKSPTLAAVLTSGRLQGRVLGASRTVDASIRALVTLSSNNMSMDADLSRRTLRCRVDSGVNPTHRRFAFDPVNEALTHRFKIAEAACVIWRAYFNAGSPRVADDDAGGFTAWSRLCRQPVLWMAREGLADRLGWQLGDPAAAMLADPSGSDPEIEAHGELLVSLHALADGGEFSAREVLEWYEVGGSDGDGAFRLLHEAVTDCLNLRAGQRPSPRSLGWMLKNRRDRAVRSLVLRARNDLGSGACSWRILQARG
jgi:hypothetical protein